MHQGKIHIVEPSRDIAVEAAVKNSFFESSYEAY